MTNELKEKIIDSQWKILNTNSLYENNNSYIGCVYALEYGNYVKIGSTKNLRTRISNLKMQANGYSDWKTGNVIYTPLHTNYYQNEKLLHGYFNNYRKNGTELFNLSLSYFIESVPILEFEDDSAQKEEVARQFTNSMIKLFYPEIDADDTQEFIKTPKAQFQTIISQMNDIFQSTQQLIENQQLQLQQLNSLQVCVQLKSEMHNKLDLLSKHYKEPKDFIFYELVDEVENRHSINLIDYEKQYLAEIDLQIDIYHLDLLDVVIHYPDIREKFNLTLNNILEQNNIPYENTERRQNVFTQTPAS